MWASHGYAYNRADDSVSLRLIAVLFPVGCCHVVIRNGPICASTPMAVKSSLYQAKARTNFALDNIIAGQGTSRVNGHTLSSESESAGENR